MPKPNSFFLHLFIIFILTNPHLNNLITTPAAATSFCNPRDSTSLLPFATNFPQLNWSLARDCCSWDGVSCDHRGVIHLSLPARALHGPIPSSLVNLTNLSLLNLSCNFLFGPLPHGLFLSLNSLQVIDLSYNRLTGQLPHTLPHTLQTLDLSSNHFNGTIHTAIPHNLTTLNISNNSFTGTIPASICNNSLLLLLDLSLNDLTGDIPQGLGACSTLLVLSLGFNNLVGRIPPDVYGIGSLRELSLPGNSLIGPIDETITNLTYLTNLVLFANSFSGFMPRGIGKLSFLEKLELHINNLTGTLPPSLTNCTNLQLVNLRVNSLVGKLSDFDFSNFTKLLTIDLGNNHFSGVLPPTLFSCKSLTAIRLATNNLQGELLPHVLQLQYLSFLSISNNTLTNITKAFNILSSHNTLTTLILSKNFFNEKLPDRGIVGFSDLKILGLGGCKLFGQIPTWLGTLKMLEVIDLSQNSISGTIPGWLGTLPNLFYLDLSQNSLSGGFPVQLTRLVALRSQEELDHVNTSYLELPVFVQPENASRLQYNQLDNLPPAFYLSGNDLSGNIPLEIGHLQSIHVLDLSKNKFSGSIPDEISNLTNLERLDLSCNFLTGEIPVSLKNLHFLSSFSVANNNLQGSIPIGGQLDTFLSISYEGNQGLCGPPMHRSCDNQSSHTGPSGHKKGPNKKAIICLILGFCSGVGVILACLALWILSKRRILPRGDADKSISLNSTSAAEVPSGVVLFPNQAKDIKDLTVSAILKATEDFSEANIIGCGGFGLVYRATLANGIKVAVKKLSGDMGLMEREFKAEVEALSTAQHKNLVSLQGYCVHDGFRLLIYSYMENGSLDYWLHEKTDGPSKLDWPTRLKITQGASCGLSYMHQICEPHIVHRDIKSSNILLDAQFEAYVGDFGLARLLQPYNTHVTTELVGTLGYIPPEYSQSWVATLRGDIYSFGVVMLELLTGKRPMEVVLVRPRMSGELVVWVQQLMREGKQVEVFDPLLRGKGFEQEMLQVLGLACMCVNVNPVKRPTISEVVDWLHNISSKGQMAT
ncbi:tyrosine-sulfated glycopeptide receptor 1-like [Cynara cardunculus var. scolymus]|uniref:tyrosine-sulfated glycopeptide receptor 1-like n=1 Tax=Cynara cardunculus var. scolymus TaxID=59895 RepID=UPI000D6306DD|nr:tyrosine-sulfated glycopeptide receptor 1-like [Cynara cardunculus var. scolymus]